MSTLHEQLGAVFGFREFRPHQQSVVEAVLAGRDSFTIMPTGGGKSLCYQLPARIMNGVCVVVSPLISLMKDQVDAARGNGLAAATLNSASPVAERNAAWRDLHSGQLDLLYVSPERLCTREFMEALHAVPLSFFAIDEAHCISSWGHDFRPDYLGLSALNREFPNTPLAAFTATATARVVDDIITRLGLRDPLYVRASFNRPNLFYQVTPRTDLKKQLLGFLREHPGESGIIYHNTRKDVERTAAFLSDHGFPALPYHAGLPDAQRADSQERFRTDVCPLIVATIAFGMGIDKPNVRFVIHADLPKNLEGYYQETGRAGRDGEAARCLLLYSRQDIARLMGFTKGIDDPDIRESARQQLWRMLDFTQKDGCRRKALLAYFDEELPGDNCGGCDICAGEVEREDGTVAAQKLLSAIVRTGNRFGARHIINIVTGKEASQVLNFGHQHLPTFGVGKDEPAQYWSRVMDALLAQHAVVVHDASFPVPVVTESGWQILRGQLPLRILRQSAKKGRAVAVADMPHAGLFERLREERTRQAKAGSVPPYVVFSDRTLREMARLLPDTPEKLLTLSGVGQHKLATYGHAFLTVITGYLEEHPEASPAPELAFAANAASGTRAARGNNAEFSDATEAPCAGGGTRGTRGDTWRETGRLLDQGLDMAAIAEARGLKPATVLVHMENLAQDGVVYPAERFMSRHRLEYLGELFAASGGWALGPVVDLARTKEAESGQPIPDFTEARLARLLLRAWSA